jgi:D-arabinitol dehydrogenase (NADP+)
MNQTMRAAVITAPGVLETHDVRVPEAREGEVRVRVAATGVCGTDLHLLHGGFEARLPLVPGHEIAGVIDQVGPGVRDLREGMRVALDPIINCGTCHHCRRGMRHHCLRFEGLGITRGGGFAEYLVAPAQNAYPIGDLSLEVASFAEPLGCIAWGMKRLEPPIGSRALLFGAGPIALLLMQALVASGVSEVSVVEPNAERRAVALQLGAKRALDPSETAQLRDLEPYGFDIVSEATGVPSVIEGLLQYATPGAKILIYSVPPEHITVRFDPYEIFRRDLTILGSFSLLGTIPTALEWLSSGRVKVEPMITHRLPIDQLGLALKYKDQPGLEGSQKVLIVPS